MVDSKDADIGDAVTEVSDGSLEASSVSGAHDIADPDAEIPAYPRGQRYEVRTSLGEGGMGEVRLCRDRVIGREVALKAILPSHANREQARARFTREARVQGQLEHPAIVPVYDFGADESGEPFFTMKRVRGVTLESVLEALRSEDAATTRLYSRHKLMAAFVQVCLAIDFANERGVIHRDLKPANVMLGGYGEVYVLDWGVAKVRSASSRTIETSSVPALRAADVAGSPASVDTGERSAPTAVGSVIGTPGYMAPEQLTGDEVDARTDVYALGAMLFEILTLEPLHGGGTLAAMMKRVLEGVDARPSVRAPRREVPPELEAICVRACAVDRSKRPAAAREIADLIEAYLSGDRDLELRRTLAKAHLERAREASARARVPDAPPAERTEALREVGRAVALDPASSDALALLMTMLTQPPKRAPAEVIARVETARAESQRRMLPRVAFFYSLAWLVLLPLPAYAGILDARLVAAPLAVWTLSAVGALVAYRYPSRTQELLKYQVLVGALAVGTSSLLLGPLFLLPSLVIMNAMATVLVNHRSRRVGILLMNALALLVPTMLAWAGYLPMTHTVEADGALRIHLTSFVLTRDGIFLMLGATHFVFLLVAVKFGAQYRDALTAAETKSEVQAWQLRQLVPAEAARALAPEVDAGAGAAT